MQHFVTFFDKLSFLINFVNSYYCFAFCANLDASRVILDVFESDRY